MKILELNINNFRNISNINFKPSPEVNIIYGNNAQGKTSLLEAIFILTGQNSFRTRKSSELIKLSEKKSELFAKIFSNSREQEIFTDISKGISYALNEVPCHNSEISPQLSAVIFSPTEMRIVKGSPAEKRDFIDGIISKIMPRYTSILNEYTKAIKQRNNALFSYKQGLATRELVEATTQVIFKPMISILNARNRMFQLLSEHSKEMYGKICADDCEILTMNYEPSIKTNNIEEIRKIFIENFKFDAENCVTSLGPHRDDIEIFLNNLPIKSFGSQGQQRSVAISLKLAECKIIENVLNSPPILLLDDVFSELDEIRRSFFWQNTSKNQIFISSCDKTGIDKNINCMKIKINSGAIINIE